MAQYLILTPLRRDGKRLAAGGLVDLTQEQAQPLLLMGAVIPDSAEAEAEAEGQAEAEAAAKPSAKSTKPKSEGLL